MMDTATQEQEVKDQLQLQNTNSPEKWMTMININGAQVNQDFNPNKKSSEFFGEQVTSFIAMGENMNLRTGT